MSVSSRLHCVRHRIAIKIFLIAFAANRLPKAEQQSRAMNTALLKKIIWLSAVENMNILYKSDLERN